MGETALPCAVETLAMYLAELAERGLSPSRIGVVRAAIRWRHQQAGLADDDPTGHAAIEELMAGVRRSYTSTENPELRRAREERQRTLLARAAERHRAREEIVQGKRPAPKARRYRPEEEKPRRTAPLGPRLSSQRRELLGPLPSRGGAERAPSDLERLVGAIRLDADAAADLKPWEREALELTLLRDRALLLLGWAGAFRRSELVGIERHHLEIDPAGHGLTVFLPTSKADQFGKGASVAIWRADRLPELCPVRAVQEWLNRSGIGIAGGPVFRKIERNGSLALKALHATAVTRIVKTWAAAAGLPVSEIGPHSLRSGYITTSMYHDKNPTRVMQHSRHASFDAFRKYARKADLWRQHPSEGVY
ncbi:tyrosine-type recombinase/integrase [Roseomonas genomospecies 6]|nr:tyrosine-type recombinase/integrase [Roseomonas genomospecies 6]